MLPLGADFRNGSCKAFELTFRVIWQPLLIPRMLKRCAKLYLQEVLELRLSIPWGALAF